MENYNILIIDDQIQNINTVIDCLENDNQNYNFLHALDGISGIKVAEEFRPNLIIIDWEMPGISGIETIKRLKAEDTTKNIPIVMLTGKMTGSDNLQTALEAGAIDYIRKPIDRIELVARVKSMLLLADSYKEIIDLKNRKLASTSMSILKTNEFNQTLLKQINEISNQFCAKNKKLEAELVKLTEEISTKIKGEAWEQFNSYFNNVHPDFLKKLITLFPSLTPAEIKLAAFLKLNLSTKEISDITFISPDSIKTSRNRLRRKLNLNAGESLVSFLISI